MAPATVPFGSVPDPNQTGYFAYPQSVFKLNPTIRHGMIPLGILGMLSVIATLGMLGYLAWQMIATRNRKEYRLYRRQLYILYFNLLLADFLQGLSFLFSFHWEALDAILAPTGACWAQGWLLHLGDVASGSFVFAIAMHTWASVAKWRRDVSYRTFVAIVLGIWGFDVLLASLPPIIRGRECYVKAAAWCWINSEFEADRLWSHYIWIFIFEFGTVIMYTAIAFKLRKHLRFFKSVSGKSSVLERQQKYMVVYPTIYVVLTLPLAASRMWSMANHGKAAKDWVMILAGCLITSCGFMDALMYSVTRNVLSSRQAASPQAANYHNHSDHHGGSQLASQQMDHYNMNDFTNMRKGAGWETDGDMTPGMTTTIISGGKDLEAGMHVRTTERPVHRSKNPFVRRGSGKRSRGTELDEKELIEAHRRQQQASPSLSAESLPSGRLQKPRPTQPRALSGEMVLPPRGRSPQPTPTFYSSRSGSPNGSDDTRVASNGGAANHFGGVTVEKTIDITRDN